MSRSSVSSNKFSIGDRVVGHGARAFLIAEVAQAHDGSLGLAHSFVDAAADAGADAIKFQTHIAAAESTAAEPFRVKFSYEDATRYDYWRRIEFSPDQWRGLADHATQRGIVFLSSPFSVEAVELLDGIGVPAWKIGSGETRNTALLDACVASGKPLLLSTGMSAWAELDKTVNRLVSGGAKFAILQCTSKYPTPLAETGVNVLDDLRARYGSVVGFSDHSASLFPPLLAMARGASIIETHVTFDRAMFGPDSIASLTFAEFRSLAAARDAFFAIDSSPVDKDRMATSMSGMRALFNKSLALKKAHPAGTVLREAMLTSKKPGTGIPADQIGNVVGKRLARDVSEERLLEWQDFEP